jgi:hypothetical protein
MQAMQAGMGALQHGMGGAAAGGAIPGGLLGAGGDAAELAGAGGGAGGDLASTTPAAQLGPPPTPSANTGPASSGNTPSVTPGSAEPTGMARGGMGGMPMMPPGAMQGGAGGTGGAAKADSKRIVTPSVKNGAPVQGRITPPPAMPEVVKRVDGKPVATRRIVAPDQKPDVDGADEGG